MHRVAVIDTAIDSRKLHCQRFESYNVCRRGGEALTGTGISHGTMAVSYTHLDVYKRQEIP